MPSADIGRCMNWITDGESSLGFLEERLFHGDLDGAADLLRSAWRDLLRPLAVLSKCWSGSFWRDWSHKDLLEGNITRAQDLLLRATPSDLEDVLVQLRDLMLTNFYLLREAMALVCADVGSATVAKSHQTVH